MRASRCKIYGPYYRGARRSELKWELIISEGGTKSVRYFSTEEEAKSIAEELRQQTSCYTIADAIEDYRQRLIAKGNKPRGIATTISRLTRWLGGQEINLSTQKLKSIYSARSEAVSVDTARNELAEVKTFFRWLVRKGAIRQSPADEIEGIGRRHKGKPQLRQSEAQRFADECLALYRSKERGHEAGLGNLMALVLGLRASEICSLKLRDIDFHSHGCTVWIADGKTDAASRRLDAPEMLQPLLLRQIEKAKKRASDWLFPALSGSGHRERTWLRKAARRIAAKADVPYAPPHGLRGTCATLASDAGEAATAVARQLGHAKERVTIAHYMEAGSMERSNATNIAHKLDTRQLGAGAVKRYEPHVVVDARYARHRAEMRESERGGWVRWEDCEPLLREKEQRAETARITWGILQEEHEDE